MKGDYCSYRNCGKPAIGYESRGSNLAINVCGDHASIPLKKMKPGTTQGDSAGGKYYVRYDL